MVRRFLERPTEDIKVVFSTYQSAKVVGDGTRGLPQFDVGIFDEAHKTIRGASTYAMSDENIRIKKRLFLTATPRHIDIRHRDKEGEFRFYSMDDEEIYGPRAYTLSFGAAAEKGIICRYKVIISLIDKEMVDDFTRRQGITLVEQDEVGARWMANLIAVEQAIERVDAKKIITFHGRVRLAQEFASSEPRGIAHHLRDFEVRHVNGEQSSGVRAEIIELFKDAPKAILTNAQCLTEGINIPAVDMVAFIDPRQSHVDITQAVGRAMRKPRGKTTKTVGYVVVPLFAGMGEKDSLDDAIKSERFEAVVDVLNSLQDHDDELLDIIRELKQRKGAGEPFNPRRLSDKLEVIGPRIDLDRLTTSISVAIADSIGSDWDEWYGRLLRYKAREGHCRVPHNYVDGAFKLGRWVVVQRTRRNKLSAVRRQRLEAIGFIWNWLEYMWEEGVSNLISFKAREGHCNVPVNFVEGEFKLGQWVTNHRNHRDTMPTERQRQLGEIGFVWSRTALKWERAISALKSFKEREGHCRVPKGRVEGGFKLGVWVNHQREHEADLALNRREQLNALGFIWDTHIDNFDEGIAALKKFKARENHCLVPAAHFEDKFRLGKWAQIQRNTIDIMPVERRHLLSAIGFVWDGSDEFWQEGLEALKAFQERAGHCRVPRFAFERGFRLGQWVKEQRKSGSSMPANRWQLLDDIGFVWHPQESEWERAFLALSKYRAREGHCLVPLNHIEGTIKLGKWVKVQQNRKSKNAERNKRMEEIGFVWRVK